jgi:hypothetical protein
MRLFFDLDHIYENLKNPPLALDEKLSLRDLKSNKYGENWKNLHESNSGEDYHSDEKADDALSRGQAVLLPPPLDYCTTNFMRVKEYYSVFTDFYFLPQFMIPPENNPRIISEVPVMQEDSIVESGLNRFSVILEESEDYIWKELDNGNLNYLFNTDKLPPYMIVGTRPENGYFISMGIGGGQKMSFQKENFHKAMNDYEKMANLFVNSIIDENKELEDICLDLFGM